MENIETYEYYTSVYRYILEYKNAIFATSVRVFSLCVPHIDLCMREKHGSNFLGHEIHRDICYCVKHSTIPKELWFSL